jgi:hypothetical protein
VADYHAINPHGCLPQPVQDASVSERGTGTHLLEMRRIKMFHLNIGTTPCQLSQADYRALADQTEGYSGSDF